MLTYTVLLESFAFVSSESLKSKPLYEEFMSKPAVAKF